MATSLHEIAGWELRPTDSGEGKLTLTLQPFVPGNPPMQVAAYMTPDQMITLGQNLLSLGQDLLGPTPPPDRRH